jgi:hypothetical protein
METPVDVSSFCKKSKISGLFFARFDSGEVRCIIQLSGVFSNSRVGIDTPVARPSTCISVFVDQQDQQLLGQLGLIR